MPKLMDKVNTLIEALPYIQKYADKIVVIKYGGSAMKSAKLKKALLEDVVLLKHVGMFPVIIHGGGPDITKTMKKAKLKLKFIDGRRVTDKRTMHIVENVFSKINKDIVQGIKKIGGKAIGIFGTDHRLIEVKQRDPKLGYVGDIKKINPTIIKSLIKDDFIPVISPIGIDQKNESFNVNADSAATAIAIGIVAEKLTLVTDVPGVLEKRKLIPSLNIKKTKLKIKKNVIKDGMIPKVEACMDAVEHGCKKAHLINGTVEHSLLLEIFTDKGIGTEIIR